MTREPRCGDRRGGYTLFEIVIALVLAALLATAVSTAVASLEGAFVKGVITGELERRAQTALDRIVELASQAVTEDAEFSPLRPSTGIGSHGLRFRLITGVDTSTSEPVYDDSAKIYILGPDDGTPPCRGVIIGRGPDLATIHSQAAGPDGYLGTRDDGTSVLLGDEPVVELLVPETFAPRTGEMFTVDVTPPPVGRLLTFTLRLNARDREGNYLLENDLVIRERVALRE